MVRALIAPTCLQALSGVPLNVTAVQKHEPMPAGVQPSDKVSNAARGGEEIAPGGGGVASCRSLQLNTKGWTTFSD